MQDPECYIINHLDPEAGAQRLAAPMDLAASIKEADRVSTDTTGSYVLFLVDRVRGSLIQQQLFLWRHDNYGDAAVLDAVTTRATRFGITDIYRLAFKKQ